MTTTERIPAPGRDAGPPVMPPTDLSWMTRTLEWGVRARVHPEGGLTLGALNVGIYADIPDIWEERSRMPRGAYPIAGVPPIGGYYLVHKSEQWADNAADLYEEAISRRWSTATDIPWEASRGLPEDVELAMCQVATELSQHGSVEAEVVSSWLQQLNYGYHEVKLFLATAVWDAGRQFEGWRKRALANGGGLGLEAPGWGDRVLLESGAGWTETAMVLQLLRGSFDATVFRYLAAYGPTACERELAARMLADKGRHAAYAMQHVKYALGRHPEARMPYSKSLTGAEAQFGRDHADHVFWEALAIVFGGGVHGMDEGMRIVERLQRDWLKLYIRRTDFVGMDRGRWLFRGLRQLLAEPASTGA